jgi:hypothetical protein
VGAGNPCAPNNCGAKLCGSLLADALHSGFVTGNVSSHDVMKQNSERDVKGKLSGVYFDIALGIFAGDLFCDLG